MQNSKQTESKKLWDLFKEYDDFIYLTHPELATFEGFHMYDDRLSDLSDENVGSIFNSSKNFLKKLSEIDYAELTEDDKLNYDLFKYDTDVFLNSEPFKLHYMPVWQQGGLQIGFITLAEFQPCSYNDEALKYLKRLEGFEKQVDDTIRNLRLGIESGLVMPDFIIQQTLPQFENITNIHPENSIFYQNCKTSDDIEPSLKLEILNAIKGKVYPLYKKLHQFIKNEYLTHCRQDAGIWSLPEGEERYKYFIKDFTTLELEPEEIHQTGLDEVIRIKSEMEKLVGELNFKGTIDEFNQHLRTDDSFYYDNKNDLLNGYRNILKKMDLKLPELFGKLPETGYDLKEIEEYMAETAPAAYYFPAPEDRKRPGYFYVNTYNLKARPKYEMTALALHEAVPGHHLQIALAQEHKNLPKFRRDWTGATSYVEGWALYSESLGYETGMYDDPYQRYGALSLEVWRACRLVVDTGIHYKKWTREQAIDYMKKNTPNSEHDIRSEVDRYIAWPAQALAYKIGELKIKELKKFAETSLNSRFNIKDFHDTILKNGALPLLYLEKIVNNWINEAKSE